MTPTFPLYPKNELMNQAELLSKLAPGSLQIYSETKMVRLDSADNPATEQTYLCLDGTPEAYRWLASLLTQMANSAEKHESGTSVIVSPRDLKPVSMTDWSSMSLACRQPASK